MTLSVDIDIHFKLVVISKLTNDNLVWSHMQHSSAVTNEPEHFQAMRPNGKDKKIDVSSAV